MVSTRIHHSFLTLQVVVWAKSCKLWSRMRDPWIKWITQYLDFLLAEAWRREPHSQIRYSRTISPLHQMSPSRRQLLHSASHLHLEFEMKTLQLETDLQKWYTQERGVPRRRRTGEELARWYSPDVRDEHGYPGLICLVCMPYTVQVPCEQYTGGVSIKG